MAIRDHTSCAEAVAGPRGTVSVSPSLSEGVLVAEALK